MSQELRLPVLSLTCLPGPTLEHSGGVDTVPSPPPGLWLSPSLHCYLTTPRAIPQHLAKALLEQSQPGAEQEAVLLQGQLAQETNGQESWPQAGDILNSWQGRKDHQDSALASKGCIAQQAGGVTTDIQGGEAAAKQVEQLLPPCPAAGSGCAGTLPGYCGAEPCSPQPGLSSPSQGCSWLGESTTMALQLPLTHNPHKHHS